MRTGGSSTHQLQMSFSTEVLTEVTALDVDDIAAVRPQPFVEGTLSFS